MEWLKICWVHDLEDEPILLFSEIDDNRFEIRKVEVYKDNSFGLAMPGYDFGGTLLGTEPLPSINEIEADIQFIPAIISKEEFEEVWEDYTSLLGRTSPGSS